MLRGACDAGPKIAQKLIEAGAGPLLAAAGARNERAAVGGAVAWLVTRAAHQAGKLTNTAPQGCARMGAEPVEVAVLEISSAGEFLAGPL